MPHDWVLEIDLHNRDEVSVCRNCHALYRGNSAHPEVAVRMPVRLFAYTKGFMSHEARMKLYSCEELIILKTMWG
jgi:hypothetical protein